MALSNGAHPPLADDKDTQAQPEKASRTYGLVSKWPVALDLAGSNSPCRLEGEVQDLIVHGRVPPEIDGVFYRVTCDPWTPPDPKNVPIDGDGNVTAFFIKDGAVDFKIKYILTDRHRIERAAGQARFGLYRNPFSHHPCVRSAVDSTANTNLVLAPDGKFLALKEVGNPYELDPWTLDTLGYDPYSHLIEARAFTAHPKLDPATNELIVFGYEAKGLGTTDVATWTMNAKGEKVEEMWVHAPWVAFIHDCVITKNWLVLMLWPFEANVERMKAGGQHWAYDYSKPVTFLVIPRHSQQGVAPGWKKGEWREYHWKNCMPIHTGIAFEDEEGLIQLDSSRVHDNAFPFFPPEDGRMPSPGASVDYVRWTLDPSKPSGAIADPVVLLDVPCEFPRTDERFLGGKAHVTFLDAFVPSRSDGQKNIFHGLNGLAMFDDRSPDKTKFFYAGDNSLIQEPAFIPRHAQAPEGDGWVMALIERLDENLSELVIIDTKDFERPVALVSLPFHVKAQIHGNYFPRSRLPPQGAAARKTILTPKRGDTIDFVKGKSALDVIA